MTRLGGDFAVVQAVKAAGRVHGFCTIWLGPWTRIEAGKCPDLAAFLIACGSESAAPHVQLFGVGDQGTEAFWDGFTTTSRGMTLARWWELVKAIGATLDQTPAIVTLEPEWAKRTLIDGAPKFDKAWSDAAHTIRGLAPNTRIVNCPGEWAHSSRFNSLFPRMVAATDIWGVQNLRCLTRDTAAHYTSGPVSLLARLKDYSITFPGKPLIVTDFCYSTYGGGFSTKAPFLGGDANAADGNQRLAMDAILALKPQLAALGVTDLIARSLRDVDMDDWGNWYGAGEDCWGVVRRDGTAKPALAQFLRLADLVPPPPVPVVPTVPEAQFLAAVAERDAAQAKLAAIRLVLG